MVNNPDLSLRQIDNVRKKGLRPQVVACFIYEHKLLMVYKKKYDLWQLPQGGIDNNEYVEQTLFREMKEELGEKFIKQIDNRALYLGDDQIIFPPKTQGSRNLRTDAGKMVEMKGKKYYFYAIEANKPKIDLRQSEFNDYKWVNYAQGINLAKTIYQKGKKRITLKALDLLKEQKII